MKDFTLQLHHELLLKLEDLDKNYDPIKFPDSRLDTITGTLEKIKQHLISHRFLLEEEEMHYFKSVLPDTLSLYIYYSDRIEWDRIRWQGSPECRYKFIDRMYTQAEKFRSDYKEFYAYCRDGKTHLDRLYFLRNSPVNQETVYPLRSIIDRNSPTIYCERLARLMAYTRLEQELHQSNEPAAVNLANEKSAKYGLKWTDKQIYLVELVYAMKEQGSFNNGKASLKDIFSFIEETFGVILGNTYRQFQDLLTRKTGNTQYLKLLTDKLQNRIDEIEQKHIK